MRKLQMKDLTPEILEEVRKLDDEKAVIKFFAERDLEISEKGAKILLEEAKKEDAELNDETLRNVAGGCGGGKRSTAS